MGGPYGGARAMWSSGVEAAGGERRGERQALVWCFV